MSAGQQEAESFSPGRVFNRGARDRTPVTRVVRAAARRGAAAVGSRLDSRLPALERFLTRGLTVFIFHEVTDTPSEFQSRTALSVSTEVFRQQIDWIRDRFEIVAPIELASLGASVDLPDRAALITFDDAWAGVFRTGLPILSALGLPALCFLNMGTVGGTPDLAAVRLYEQIMAPSERQWPGQQIGVDDAESMLKAISEAYGGDPDYLSFQGMTATYEDLDRAVASHSNVWFASHLFHHWDLRCISRDVFTESAQSNAEALSAYDNSLPALATPYGTAINGLGGICRLLGIRLVFLAGGGQNRDPMATMLDRTALQAQPSGPGDWWYSAHSRRLFGALANS